MKSEIHRFINHIIAQTVLFISKKSIKNLNIMNNFNYKMGKTLIGDDVIKEDLYFFNGYV